MKTNFFSFSDEELELANVFIQDGWHGDMHTLQRAVEILTEAFRDKEAH